MIWQYWHNSQIIVGKCAQPDAICNVICEYVYTQSAYMNIFEEANNTVCIIYVRLQQKNSNMLLFIVICYYYLFWKEMDFTIKIKCIKMYIQLYYTFSFKMLTCKCMLFALRCPFFIDFCIFSSFQKRLLWLLQYTLINHLRAIELFPYSRHVASLVRMQI